MFLQECVGRVQAGEPAGVAQKAVALVREYQFAIGDAPGCQLAGEQKRLREVDIAIVAAVDQQYGRAPAFDSRQWRRLPLEPARRFLCIRREAVRNGTEQRVNAVEIDADLEQVAVPRE